VANWEEVHANAFYTPSIPIDPNTKPISKRDSQTYTIKQSLQKQLTKKKVEVKQTVKSP